MSAWAVAGVLLGPSFTIMLADRALMRAGRLHNSYDGCGWNVLETCQLTEAPMQMMAAGPRQML